jgi:nucleotide-binding universal stress UspA family protein
VTDNSAMSIVGEIVNYESEFAKLLLGSVTSGVTVYALCTVMVVK